MTNRPEERQTRPLSRIVATAKTIEGGGFTVNRSFPTSHVEQLDPFLLLDEVGPVIREPGEAIGAPPHPHRGFETVTYILQGEVEHKDSAGNQGLIETGGVQWMTAGDGVVHSEMPSARTLTEGGTGHAVQIWVNLPSTLRRTTPRYQSLPNHQLATTSGDRWDAVVIAGSVLGVDGPPILTLQSPSPESRSNQEHHFTFPSQRATWQPSTP